MKVVTHLPKELEVNAGVHQGSALPPLLLSIEIDVATNYIMEGTVQEILHADNFCPDCGDHGGTA